jgi:uncharacterized protein (TIRG00374 family)
MKKIFSLLGRLFITLAILFLVFKNLKLATILISLKEANIFILVLALILLTASSFILSIRWNIFLKKYKRIKSTNLFKIYWASDFVNLFGLASVGGEIYKMFMFKKDRKKVLFSSLLSRIYSLIGFCIFGVSIMFSYWLFSGVMKVIFFALLFFIILTSFSILIDRQAKKILKQIVTHKNINSFITESHLNKNKL